jgi:two-component system cell cycle response regulator
LRYGDTAIRRYGDTAIRRYGDTAIPLRCSIFVYIECSVRNRPDIPIAQTVDNTCGHILIVEDDAVVRVMLAAQLQSAGHTVSNAKHGKEALEILQCTEIDLVLLDLWMPEMGGLETLRSMKADPTLTDIPVIMVSGVSDLAHASECIEHGAEDYLCKPVDEDELLACVRESLALGCNDPECRSLPPP